MVFAAPAAVAQTEDYDKFSLSLGVFFTDRETDTRVDTTFGSPGSNVDLEEELGLDKSDSVFRFDGLYRFAPKHQLDFSAFDLSRSASTVIQETFTWDDTEFEIDSSLNSEFDLKIYKAAYTWRFLQRPQGYLGVTGGLYIADMQMILSAPLTNLREASSTTAPLPVFGLRGEYNFSERWSFRASGEIFVYESGDFDGSLYDVYAGFDYRLFENMALGIGVNTVRMDLGVTKAKLRGELDWQYEGGLLYFKFNF
jgi:hypothetical protein